jgi:hypothetical protein
MTAALLFGSRCRFRVADYLVPPERNEDSPALVGRDSRKTDGLPRSLLVLEEFKGVARPMRCRAVGL